MINIRHLRAFIAVVEEKHFTRAAERVFISQSALSALIQQMESEYNVKLFDRNTRYVEPTAIGLELYQAVRTFLAEFDDALHTLSEYGTLKRGRVSIGVLPTLAETVLPSVIVDFQRQFPGISIDLVDAPGEELVALLHSRRIDLALSRTVTGRNLHATPLFHDRLVLVGHLKAIQPDGKAIAWESLVDEPVIVMEAGTTIRTLIDSATAQAGVILKPVLTPRLIPTALALARAGLGCTIIPSSEKIDGTFADLPHFDLVRPNIRREISLMSLSSVDLTASAQAMASFLVDSLSATTPPKNKAQ